MQSKTSYFNRTLFRRNLTRFWPLWALYFAVWFLLVPLAQFLTLFGGNARMGRPERIAAEAVGSLLESGVGGGLALGIAAGCLFAMALFSYLCTARSVGMMHALPIRREGLFLTNYLSGCAVFTGTLAVNGLLVAAIQGAAGILVWKNVAVWFACAAGQMLFFWSFAVFCAMFTGQILAIPAFYGIWNVVIYGLYSCVQTFAGLFLYGYSRYAYGSQTTPAWVRWLTPVYALERDVTATSTWDDALECSVNHGVKGLGTLGVYVLAGLGLAVLALAVYRRRQSETAGDTVAIPWARQLFRLGAGLCAAMTLGQGLYTLLWDQFFYGQPTVGLAAVCMILLGLVGFYGADMLLEKSFRVFRSGWRGAVITVAVVAALGLGVRLDVLGIENRIPEAADVKQAYLQMNGEETYLSGDVTDPEAIEEILALHQRLIDEKADQRQRAQTWQAENAAVAADDGADGELRPSASMTVAYTLENGRVLSRSYSIRYLYDELDQPDSLISQAAALVRIPAIQRASLSNGEDLAALRENLENGSLDYLEEVTADGGRSYGGYPFEKQVARQVLDAVLRDMDAGRAGGGAFRRESWSQRYVNTLYFYYNTVEDGRSYSRSTYLYISPAYTETIAALEELGIVTEYRGLQTEREVQALEEAVQLEETETAFAVTKGLG